MHIEITNEGTTHHLYTSADTGLPMYKATDLGGLTVTPFEVALDTALPHRLVELLNENDLHMIPLKAYKNKIADTVTNAIHEHKLEIRAILIEELNKDLEFDRVNEILTECGLPVQKKEWMVTVEYDGNEVEIPVKADNEDEAVSKVSDNISSHATITFTYSDPENGDEFELEGDVEDIGLDDLYITAEMNFS